MCKSQKLFFDFLEHRLDTFVMEGNHWQLAVEAKTSVKIIVAGRKSKNPNGLIQNPWVSWFKIHG